MKAMAIEGVTYGKRRKVTNSIIAQSEIKKIVPVGRLRGAWRKGKACVDLRTPCVQEDTERCGAVRYAALDGGTAGKLHARNARQGTVAPALAGRPVLLCARCEAGKGGAGWRSCRRKT